MNWSFWFELFVRSAALLVTGEALRRWSKLQSAAFRHRLLLGVFGLLMALPVLTVLCPEIRIPLPGFGHAHASAVTVQEVSSTTTRTLARHSIDWLLVVWVTGVFLSLAPLLTGAAWAWRITRRARPFSSQTLPDILEKLSHQHSLTPDILVSNDLRSPLTCGVVRPRILLPAIAEDWGRSRLHAVLAHELAHARRGDVRAQVAVHVVAAVWWFQPLVWMLRRSLRGESELACDAEAVQSGFRASEYATELLSLAKPAGPDCLLSSSAISMARSFDLNDRVRAILSPRSALSPARRTYAVVVFVTAGLGTAALASSTLSVGVYRDSRLTSSKSGGSTMKRTILSALLTSAGLSAATISGSINDSAGGAVADAKVVVYNPDTSAKQETATDSDGRFSFDGAAAGQYILRVEKPGYASLFREFDLKADSQLERQFTMPSQGGQPVPDKVVSTRMPGSKEDTTGRAHIGGLLAQSNLTTKIQPVYPLPAKQSGTQGVVNIEAAISKDGVPVELRVLASPSDELSQSALEAVRQWRYRPTLLNGLPVEVVTNIVVTYTLAP